MVSALPSGTFGSPILYALAYIGASYILSFVLYPLSEILTVKAEFNEERI